MIDRQVIARALADALILRQETGQHDIDGRLRDALVAASLPAFIAWEASREAPAPGPVPDVPGELAAILVLLTSTEPIITRMTGAQDRLRALLAQLNRDDMADAAQLARIESSACDR